MLLQRARTTTVPLRSAKATAKKKRKRKRKAGGADEEEKGEEEEQLRPPRPSLASQKTQTPTAPKRSLRASAAAGPPSRLLRQ